ncbi:MAG: hypothetical protein AB7H96_11885 [Vicinamibacterales bacterium]
MQLLSTTVEHSPVIRSDTAVIVASGLLGTLGMTTIMYLAPLVGTRQVDAPLWIARIFVTTPTSAIGLGLSLHLVVGFAYAWLFARHIEPRLTEHPLRNGLVFGGAIWAFAQAIAVPATGSVAAAVGTMSLPAPGVLSVRLGVDGALVSLLAHLVYGSIVGSVYGCLARGLCVGRTCQRSR